VTGEALRRCTAHPKANAGAVEDEVEDLRAICEMADNGIAIRRRADGEDWIARRVVPMTVGRVDQHAWFGRVVGSWRRCGIWEQRSANRSEVERSPTEELGVAPVVS
jgi:hypothetical protein